MHSHASSVRKRPAFPKTTKVSGEYADGVYNKNLQQWFAAATITEWSNLTVIEVI